MRAFRHTLGLVGVTALATLLGALSTPPASADDPAPIPIVINGFGVPLYLQSLPGVISGELDGPINVTLPAAEGGQQVASQCVQVPDTISNMCVGLVEGADNPPPIEVIGESELLPMLKDPAAQVALGWLELEGREAIRLQYDLPNDARVERFARPEIRNYMTDRLLGIMDKSVYGVALTDNEQRALTFLEETYRKRELILAQSSWDVFEAFQSRPCRFKPPTAPAAVPAKDVAVMPKKVIQWCLAHPDFDGGLTTLVDIAPPLPSVDTFVAWGAYAAADELGLTAFSSAAVEDGLARTIIGTTAAIGFALAVPVGIAIANLPFFAGITFELGRALFPFAQRVAYKFAEVAAEGGAELASAGGGAASSTVAGAIGAAIVIAVVIIAAVVIGVASWLVAEHQTVVNGLTDYLSKAKDNPDPLGLADYRKKWSGTELGSQTDAAHPPTYRDGEAHQRLAALLTLMSTVKPDGTVVPEPTGLWKGGSNATDRQWVVQVGDNPTEVRDQISVPQQADGDAEQEYATVRATGGWFVVDTADTPKLASKPQLALSFGYYDRPRKDEGRPRLVARAPSTLGGLIVTDSAFDNGKGLAERRTWLVWQDKQGRTVQARLKKVVPTYLAGPRPVAVGPMYARRPVMLRPNPVGPSGQSIDQALAESDFDTQWTVDRRNPDTGVWEEIKTASGYGTSFVPSTAGDYQARVSMTAIDNPDQQKFGRVEFTVTPPPILTPVATLLDNGTNRLELDLQLAEDVADDAFDVQVTWPGTYDDPVGPTQTLAQTCFQSGPLDCTAQRTGPSDLLVHPVTLDTDLSQPVRLVVTNSTGQRLERQFLAVDGRPQVAPPPDGVNAGQPGTVDVSERTAQVTMPLAPGPDGADTNQDYTVATLVPSAGGGQDFALVDPVTGNTTAGLLVPGLTNGAVEVYEEAGTWYLAVRGIPGLAYVGTHELDLLVAQTNGTRQAFHLSLQITPTTSDRFRGAVNADLDPVDFGVADRPQAAAAVVGGLASDPAYGGGMCVRLRFVDLGPAGPSATKCGPRSDFYDAAGVARPFPYELLFPTGMAMGTYRADTWLTQVNSRVDNAPLGISFVLTDPDAYGAPPVSVASVAAAGKPRVGRALKAALGTVYPSTATRRYQWLRDGRAVKGATGARYVLRSADVGSRLSLRVTTTAPDYKRTVRTSARTGVVRR